MMERCIELAVRSGRDGEYPYAAVIRRADQVLVESTNRVAHEHDVTRHAEVVAISQAQRQLGAPSLDDCAIYVNAEPCAYCSYAIRESRIRRVVYGLRSPHMGGVLKWNVLADDDLSNTMPEVFAPPPEIIAGFMAREVEEALSGWNPTVWSAIKRRGLLVAGPLETVRPRDRSLKARVVGGTMAMLRRVVFDRFGRS